MKLCINSEYAPEYLKEAAEQYAEVWQINEAMFVHGSGHRKTTQQRHYEKLKECSYLTKETVSGFFGCFFPYPGVFIRICFKLGSINV